MNLVQNFPISFKNPETFLKLPNFLDDMKITCLKATQKETKNIINNQTFLVKYPDMLEDICDGSQSHQNIDRREASHKICGRIKQRQSE